MPRFTEFVRKHLALQCQKSACFTVFAGRSGPPDHPGGQFGSRLEPFLRLSREKCGQY